MGISSDNIFRGNETYELYDKETKLRIMDRHKTISAMIGLEINDKSEIPIIYWLPKLHKNPVKMRFITGAYNSSMKALSIKLLKVLKHIKGHFSNYCNIIYRNRKKKVWWSIDNAAKISFDPKLGHNKIFIADFSNLFTNLPHDIVKQGLFKVLEIFFRNAKKNIKLNYNSAYYTEKDSGTRCYDLNRIKFMISYLLDNSFAIFSKRIFRQKNGIPQGNNCSPLIADLTLAYYEYNYLISKGNDNFTGYRYMDDILIMYNPLVTIEQIISELYPKELNIIQTNQNEHGGNFLDLRVFYKSGRFETGLYNKTDDFTFTVTRLQKASSNISFNIKHACIIGKIIRINRCCSTINEFVKGLHQLIKVAITNGFKKTGIRKIITDTIY